MVTLMLAQLLGWLHYSQFHNIARAQNVQSLDLLHGARMSGLHNTFRRWSVQSANLGEIHSDSPNPNFARNIYIYLDK